MSCTVEGLTKLFAPFGTVVWTRLIIDSNSQTFSFGYVQMSNQGESLAAIAGLNNTTVLEKIIRVVASTQSPEEIRDDG
jgi:RNA recognition motif-containing protein